MKGCRSCTHWQNLEEELDRIDPATNGQKVRIGLCRRFAPRPATVMAGEGERPGQGEARWARVASDDWCGEWEPRLV